MSVESSEELIIGESYYQFLLGITGLGMGYISFQSVLFNRLGGFALNRMKIVRGFFR